MNTESSLLTQLRFRSGNCTLHEADVRVLIDSGENFPAWRDALLSAQHFILIEMYIFAPDAFGQTIRDILIEKAKNGVQVVLVYDWLGSMNAAFRGFFKPLQEAGAMVVAYNPIGFASGMGLLSRNHRKSIIIDGHTAFVSGLCMSSAWDGKPSEGVAPWRDTGVMIKGTAAVADLIAAFSDTLQSQGQVLPKSIGERLCEQPSYQGNIAMGIVATTANNNNMMRLDLNAIALANQRLWLTDAYFMPTRLYTQALIYAAQSGVDVRILVPKTSDIRWIARVSRTRYRELLQAGVRVFEWNGTMIHAKSAVADGVWARIGSTNLNFSSWHLNRELDVVLENPEMAQQMEQQFLRDLSHATEIVLNDEDRAVAVEKRKFQFSQLKIINRQQAQAVTRQFFQLSRAFEGNFYGAQIVDKSEGWAYLSLGATLLAAVLLLWLMPYLLVIPVMLILLAGGVSTVIYAIRRLRSLKK